MVKIYDPQKRKNITIGKIVGDDFYKKVDPKKHLMRIMNAYGIQEEAIKILIDNEVKTIIIDEPNRRWTSSIDEWLRPGIKIREYKHGKQRFLPLKYMKET